MFKMLFMSLLKYLRSNVGALAAGTGGVSWDITKGVVIDFSLVLAKMLEEDFNLLGRIKVGEPANSTNYRWTERRLTALLLESVGRSLHLYLYPPGSED